MKLKHLIFLFVVLLVLILGVAVKQLHKPPEIVTEEFSSLDLNFDPAKVDKIEIGRNNQKLVELAKDEKQWRVVGAIKAKADPKKVEDLLNSIRDAKGELRAKDKLLFGDFGIKDEEAIKISFLDAQGKPVTVLLIGTKNPAGSSSIFLRKADSDKIYLANVGLLPKMGLYGDPATDSPKTDFWSDLTLVKFDVDQISKVESRRFKDGVEFITIGVERGPDPADPKKIKWKFLRADAPFAIEANKVRQFFSSFQNWRASKTLDPAAKDYGFDKPRLRMNVSMDGSSEVIITAGGEDVESKGIYMQVSGEPLVYLMPNYYFQNMDIDDSKFFVDNPLAVEPEKIEKLVIHANDKELTFNPKEKKWESLTTYLNDLKTFSATKLVFDPNVQNRVQPNGPYWFEVKKEGVDPVIIDFDGAVSDQDKDRVARMRNNTVPFAISESEFNKFFENIDRVKEIQTTPSVPEQPVPATDVKAASPVPPPIPAEPEVVQSAPAAKAQPEVSESTKPAPEQKPKKKRWFF